MSKARQFIKDYTRGCSNETTPLGSFDHTYHEWLTPEQALAAVEIAKGELIDKACEWLKSYRQDAHDGTGYIPGIVDEKTIEDFKQAMEESK